MRKITTYLILGLLLLSGTVFSQNNAKYELKNGTVKYTMSMMGSESTMTLYFTDYGKIECSETSIEMFGQKMHNRNIFKDGVSYILDMTQKTYTKVEQSEEERKKNNFLNDEAEMAKEGINKVDDEEFMAKKCKVYTSDKDGNKIKFWVWKGLMLKMETVAQGMTVSLVANEIDESAPAKTLYEIPEDFTVKE